MQRKYSTSHIDINNLVSEKVMGWKHVCIPYSLNMHEAWDIVTKLSREGRVVKIQSMGLGDDMWMCDIYNNPNDPRVSGHSEDENPAMAICLAALEAEGIAI